MLKTNSDKNPPLDPSLQLRNAKWADVNAVAKLIHDVCEADGDVIIATTPEELERDWHTNGFNPELDAFVVETSNGQVVGYVELYNVKDYAHLNVDGYFHPLFKSIGGMMLQRVEDRAYEVMKLAAPGLRVFLRSATDGRDEFGRTLHANLGYSPVRFHWRMEITLDAPPSAAVFPQGVELRPFDKEAHARLVWQADNEAFSEHWGMHAYTFEYWANRRFNNSDFDPTLWQIAWDDDQIAGFSINRYRMGIGWVGSLGVLKPWRKHGLGLALLQQSFAEFYSRGMKTVGLGVDASNTTGATRLYQRAGMSVASEFVTFEKELRPGRDLEDASERL